MTESKAYQPETVGAYFAAAGLGYVLPTLCRRVAAIRQAHRVAEHPLNTRHPVTCVAIRLAGRNAALGEERA